MKQLATALLAVTIALPAVAADAPTLDMQTRIRQEGFRNSKVMEYAQGLTDSIGPRLTGSPGMKQANEWTKQKLQEMGLANAHLESWKFGRGWTVESCSVRMVSPVVTPLYGIAKAWSPSTNGPVRGKIVRAKIESAQDLEKYKGKLAGAIVLVGDVREMKPQDKAALDRYDEQELTEIASYQVPSSRDQARIQQYMKTRGLRKQLAQFAIDEKVAAFVDGGNGEAGILRVQSSGTWRDDESIGVPAVSLAAEQFNRLARLADKGTEIELEIDLQTTFHDKDLNAYNTIADLPGSDKKGEIVLIGAHLDSWHTGTGATDNASGVAVMMEAMRILQSLGVTPKRTIRIGLWAGEEQGLLGSRAYVAQHVATRAEPKDPAQRDLPNSMRTEKTPLEVKPEHAKISAYFNYDNGTGKIRGIYAQENAAVYPIFKSWIAPLEDLGVTTVTMRNTSSTDHIPFDDAGVPGFQFIQDQVEYFARTHHTNWDTFERLQREDLMQAAVVVATFVWETANRPEMLPRKPMPK
ncbi:MAG: M20/M25/M40 family metallo-hydrolase [Thermoanaerobaculia bacterium]